MKTSIFLFFLICLCACVSPLKTTDHSKEQIKSSEIRNGEAYETAIIIYESTEAKGIKAEYDWLKDHYPGYTFNMQLLSTFKKHTYDIFKIVTNEGKETAVYFDICNFFGKQ